MADAMVRKLCVVSRLSAANWLIHTFIHFIRGLHFTGLHCSVWVIVVKSGSFLI